MATSSGRRATQATRPWPSFGKDRKVSTPETIARPSRQSCRSRRSAIVGWTTTGEIWAFTGAGRGSEMTADFLGVVGRPHEHPRVHRTEAHRTRLVSEPLERLRRYVAIDRRVVAGGAQVLTERHNVDGVTLEIGQHGA